MREKPNEGVVPIAPGRRQRYRAGAKLEKFKIKKKIENRNFDHFWGPARA